MDDILPAPMSSSRFTVDPLDARAPSREVWASLSEAERRAVVAALPSEFPSASPAEGDRHRLPKTKALEALSEYFRRMSGACICLRSCPSIIQTNECSRPTSSQCST